MMTRELNPGEAVAAAAAVLAVSVLTAAGAVHYEDAFVDVESWSWCIYVVSALATFLMAMAMAVLKTTALAWGVTCLGILSVTSLTLWFIENLRRMREYQLEAARQTLLDENNEPKEGDVVE